MSKSIDPEYFNQLNNMLKARERAIPTLLVDLDILDDNIATLQASLRQDVDYRIVVKSLPSAGMLSYVRERTGSDKLMVFHQPFLTDIALTDDGDLDILLGKPMPVKTARYFYKSIAGKVKQFKPEVQIQWLVDTQDRLLQYIDVAKSINQKIRINLEINVGLHRGGFDNLELLKSALGVLQRNSDCVEFSGLMGYDPHVAKVPSILRSRSTSLSMANDFYRQCKELIKSNFADLWSDKLTFNGAGSPTVGLHNNDASPLNDISVGSALVKPTTFDIDTLDGYRPAAFIATPVLKKSDRTTIPGLERIGKYMPWGRQSSLFLYGGYWKADYCYPLGAKSNKLFGESTNQTMVNVPSTAIIDVDDFVFLRPRQSEYVFLHFGKILAVRNFEVVGEWDLLKS